MLSAYGLLAVSYRPEDAAAAAAGGPMARLYDTLRLAENKTPFPDVDRHPHPPAARGSDSDGRGDPSPSQMSRPRPSPAFRIAHAHKRTSART